MLLSRIKLRPEKDQSCVTPCYSAATHKEKKRKWKNPACFFLWLERLVPERSDSNYTLGNPFCGGISRVSGWDCLVLLLCTQQAGRTFMVPCSLCPSQSSIVTIYLLLLLHLHMRFGPHFSCLLDRRIPHFSCLLEFTVNCSPIHFSTDFKPSQILRTDLFEPSYTSPEKIHFSLNALW